MNRDMERFFDKVSPEPNTGCWLWTGAYKAGLYGQFWHDGRLHPSHRWLYEQTFGPIDKKLVIDHLCRVSLCVNPRHLEPVTNRENTLRGKTSALRVRKPCVNGHPRTPENTLRRTNGLLVCRPCATNNTRRCRARKKAAAAQARMGAGQ